VVRFLRQELPLLRKYARVESDVSEDMFAIEPAIPRFHLVVKGSPASLAGTFSALYGDLELIACKPDSGEHFGIPDPDDFLRYTVRNMAAEAQALALLGTTAFKGEFGDGLAPIVGQREVLNFLSGSMPALRRKGWLVEVEGRVSPYFDSLDYATPVVHVNDADSGWFEVGFEFEDRAGSSLSQADIQRALRKGDSYVDLGGRIVLIDSDAVNSMLSVFSDCASEEGTQPGRFRLADIYGPFVKASLDALDGVDVEAKGKWQLKASQCNREMRVEPVQLDEALEKTLRGYQKSGVEWLRFLEVNGFCGLLADEMGLGKTAQMLAWLQLERHDGEAKKKPALIVCPTSLVENWTEEASRFTPGLRMLELTGPDRQEKWEHIGECDVAVTSYALLRRDIDTCLKHEFSAAVLDEAQHIKHSHRGHVSTFNISVDRLNAG
jgi:hypothetical protein